MSTIHHDITTPAPPRLQEVDDGVFAYIQPDGTWWIIHVDVRLRREAFSTPAFLSASAE